MTEKNNRIKLNATEVAFHTKKSVANIYWKVKHDPAFPKPHKVPGRRASFWYKDEIDAYEEKQEKRRTFRKEVLNLAWHCADAVNQVRATPDDAPHPFITAFLLAGGDSLEALTAETGLPAGRVRQLAEKHGDATDDEVCELFIQAVAQVLRREKELRQRIEADPALTDSEPFLKLLYDLDEAHALCFGRSLIEYLLKEGREDGTA